MDQIVGSDRFVNPVVPTFVGTGGVPQMQMGGGPSGGVMSPLYCKVGTIQGQLCIVGTGATAQECDRTEASTVFPGSVNCYHSRDSFRVVSAKTGEPLNTDYPSFNSIVPVPGAASTSALYDARGPAGNSVLLDSKGKTIFDGSALGCTGFVSAGAGDVTCQRPPRADVKLNVNELRRLNRTEVSVEDVAANASIDICRLAGIQREKANRLEKWFFKSETVEIGDASIVVDFQSASLGETCSLPERPDVQCSQILVRVGKTECLMHGSKKYEEPNKALNLDNVTEAFRTKIFKGDPYVMMDRVMSASAKNMIRVDDIRNLMGSGGVMAGATSSGTSSGSQ